MKTSKDVPASMDHVFNLGVRLIAASLVINKPGMSMDDALLKASETFTDVSKRHCYLLENLPRGKSEDELAALPPTAKKEQVN